MTAPTEEDPHMVLHIYEGDGALVVREGGNMTVYGTQHPRLMAAFGSDAAGLPSDHAGLVKLACEYRPTMDKEVLHSWAGDVVAALSRAPEAKHSGTWSECATEGCGRAASVYFQRGGVGSHYCCDCYMKVQALATPPAPQPIGSDTCLDGRAWQTMDSAPKDGTKVDLWIRPFDAFEVGNERRLTDAKFHDGHWCHFVPIAGWRSIEDSWYPTHWMPLPARPKAGSDSDA